MITRRPSGRRNRWRDRVLETARYALAAALLLAGAAVEPASAGRVPVPEPAPGRGDACVEPTEVMRREHMNFILHQRDKTVFEGIRSSRHSLKGCIDCHAVRGSDGQFVRHDDPQHFCAGCHAYAAVDIDCFECHADRPPVPAPVATAPARAHARLPAFLPPQACAIPAPTGEPRS